MAILNVGVTAIVNIPLDAPPMAAARARRNRTVDGPPGHDLRLAADMMERAGTGGALFRNLS